MRKAWVLDHIAEQQTNPGATYIQPLMWETGIIFMVLTSLLDFLLWQKKEFFSGKGHDEGGGESVGDKLGCVS